ncbi:PREDICTED: DNA replication complex GINS protein PSF3 isoform X2 [Pseudopodoces humilis]|uniref:DNA replication complex GINS protein PSF3 isoform X2 n=1 Tax=Pseudopodoces humilis TaxID=181119 RepID=UPI0006B6D74A|nr:PREDICTED: DNA replication complex GINS protein PSF3 isoform X2 [Pseudopodoces humilis]
MSEAYFPVGPGLGMEENFFSLDDILMSQEKLPGRAETALPRLAVLLGRGAGSAESVPETFIARFRRIMDSSQNAYNEDTSVLVARLDELERALFQVGQKGLNDFQGWEKGQASQITASSLVQNYGKRKLAEVDG